MENDNFFPKSIYFIWVFMSVAAFCYGIIVLFQYPVSAEIMAFSLACALGETVLIVGFLQISKLIKTADLLLFIGLELILGALVGSVWLNGGVFLFFTIITAAVGWENDNTEEIFVLTAGTVVLTLVFVAVPSYQIALECLP